MNRPVLSAAVLLGLLAVAAALRLRSLDNRPMHCDEAVHAVKFGRLLEQDDYVYNPYEYHGPSLNYLTLPIAWAARTGTLAETSEVHLRLLPAIFGLLLIALVWLIREELGRPAALAAAALTALSPAMIFFSRYYIQEMLLVCFTFAAMVAVWRYARAGLAPASSPGGAARTRRLNGLWQICWAVLFGLCAGMMHATKETCVITLGIMLLAAVVGVVLAVAVRMLVAAAVGIFRFRRFGWQRLVSAAAIAMLTAGAAAVRPWRRLGWKRLPAAGLIAVLAAAAVSALFFSSFGRNPYGIVDSVTTYFHYLGRASGEGSAGRHYQGWSYYLDILFGWRQGSAVVCPETPIAALALVGLIAAVIGKGLGRTKVAAARFIAIYAVLMTAVYSALPYKTPWCALSFLHGLILLAGVGAGVLLHVAPDYISKGAALVLILAALGHLASQAWTASFDAYEDPANPYVYAQTTSDVPLLARRIEEIAAAAADAEHVPVQLICPDHDYWPLPWYLRRLGRVGGFDQVPEGPAAPLIITQPQFEPALLKWLYEDAPPGQRHLYVPLPPPEQEYVWVTGGGRRYRLVPVLPWRTRESDAWELRPYVPLLVYVRLDLREAYQAKTAAP